MKEIKLKELINELKEMKQVYINNDQHEKIEVVDYFQEWLLDNYLED